METHQLTKVLHMKPQEREREGSAKSLTRVVRMGHAVGWGVPPGLGQGNGCFYG